jgi:hypothetical protein
VAICRRSTSTSQEKRDTMPLNTEEREGSK